MSAKAVERSSADSKWLLIQKPKAVAYRGPSGKSDPALLDRAEKREGFVCIYVIGELENGKMTGKVRIGTAADPVGIFKTSQQHNWREIIVHGVMWTPGKIWADKVKTATEAELEDQLIRGSWYEIDPATICSVILVVAKQIKAELFTDLKRYQIYEEKVAQAIAQRGLLRRGRAVVQHASAKIITLNRRR